MLSLAEDNIGLQLGMRHALYPLILLTYHSRKFRMNVFLVRVIRWTYFIQDISATITRLKLLSDLGPYMLVPRLGQMVADIQT